MSRMHDHLMDSLTSDREPSHPGRGAAGGRHAPLSGGYPDIWPEIDPSVDDPFPVIRFPGMGAITNDGSDRTGEGLACGRVKFSGLCSADPSHYQRPVYATCGRATCPICWGSWAARAAERIASRVDGYRWAQAGQSTLNVRKRKQALPRHVTLSPAPERVVEWIVQADGDYAVFKQKLMTWGRKQFGILGFTGAAVVAHNYRIRSEMRAEAEKLSKLRGANRYRAPVPEIMNDSHEWLRWFRLSPHLHLIAYGYARIPSGEYYQATGDRYEIHRAQGRGVKKVAGLAYYLLTHCSPEGNRAAVRYWGCLSAKYLKATAEWAREDVICPVCGAVICRGYVGDDGRVLSLDPSRPLQKRKYQAWYELRGIYVPPAIPKRLRAALERLRDGEIDRLRGAFA